MTKPTGTTNGTSGGGAGSGAEATGDKAREAYYDSLERVNANTRALLDTFGETIRRARGVEAIDRGPTDREVALQLRLTAATYIDVADGLAPALRPVKDRDEVTTETKRIKRRPDSEPGRKRS